MLAVTVGWLLAVLAPCLAGGHDVRPPVVCLGETRVVGSWMTSYRERAFAAFRAIPYAKPPVGHLRFRNPVPAELPPGVLNASSEPPECIQKRILLPQSQVTVTGQEDCLYLNVYSHPKLTNLPVLVYIYGGAFFAGSSASVVTGPKLLMDRDIVLVTMNYRLGPMGFLSVDGEEAPGNVGLKDQVLALRWVRRHVAAFGGDPRAVTIMGQSAGAISVHLHMLSPMSDGLFQRAISNSGTALVPLALPTVDPEALARRHASLVGCDAAPATPAFRVVACLRRVDAAHLVNTTTLLKVFWEEPLVLYRLTVETSGAWEQRFMPLAPLDIIRKAITHRGPPAPFTRVPWLTGVVSQEGILRIISEYPTTLPHAQFNPGERVYPCGLRRHVMNCTAACVGG